MLSNQSVNAGNPNNSGLKFSSESIIMVASFCISLVMYHAGTITT